MATTTKGLFYPLGTDQVNINGNIQSLAESVDTKLNEYTTSASVELIAQSIASSASANAALRAAGTATDFHTFFAS